MNKQEIYKWLDKNIEAYERTVIILQNKVDNYDKIIQESLGLLEEQPKEYYIESLNNYKYMLNIYQQVKVELEAWEVVKKYCDYQDSDKYNCIPEGFYSVEPIKGKDFLIVRKALEVE